MARTELPNGVILPAEYSDDWYEDMTSNLTKLDDVIGSDSEKLNADGVDFLRMSSAALTDGGTGNFSDLNSSYKIKTGDLVLDSGRKLYQVVSVDSTNERFTVGNSLFKITAESDLAPVAESGDYDDLDNKPDLNLYDQHIANTDIHVTTADKTKWNTVALVKQLRLVNAQVGSATTIAFVNIDDTNGIKVGDKCMDLDGKLFEITAVDTTNQTVTVGSALIDLALDANVVHTSGVETVGGQKTFSDNLSIYNSDNSVDTPVLNIKTSKYVKGDTTNTDTMRINFLDSNGNNVASVYAIKNIGGTQFLAFQVYTTDNNNANITSIINYYISKNGDKYFVPYEDGQISLGSGVRHWKSVYATNYYYGANNVEFSTKFVTTDTDQSVSGQKVFNDINAISSSAEIGVSAGNNSFKILDKNKKTISRYEGGTFSTGMAYSYFLVNNGTDVFNGISLYQASANLAQLRPFSSTLNMQLGATNRYFSDCYTSKINGLTPSSLGMPSDRSARVDISGYFTNMASGDTNTYTAPSNGWIYLALNDVTAVNLASQTSGGLTNYGDYRSRSSNGAILCLFPIRSSDVFVSQWYTTTTVTVTNAYFIPCQGNI